MSDINWFSSETELIESGKFEMSSEYKGIKVKGSSWSKGMLIRYYEDIVDLKSFIFVLYQIRCNLFHWKKDPSEEADQDVMKNAVPALKEFLEKLYSETHILWSNN